MSLIDKAKALYASLNTHTVGGVGLGTALLGLAAICLQHPVDQYLAANHQAGLQSLFDFFAQQLAAPVTATAIYAAYVGRPHFVKGNDESKGSAPSEPGETKQL